MTTLSAIVPTRDRPELLRDTLTGLAHQDIGSGALEVVIVDDGSRSDLRPIVATLDERGVRFRLERQDPSGLNVARNRGAAVATGELLAYLDDDVFVPRHWARAIVEGFERMSPDALAGRVRLRLGGEPPRWLSPRLRRYLSELELGDEPRWLADHEDPYGANCAVTRAAFDQAGGFGAALDREGASLRSNGDVEFFRRLRAEGRRIAYWPPADVDHRVPADRLTAEWFRRRAYSQGHSDELLLPVPTSGGERVRRMAREAVRAGRAGPILARNVALGRGVTGATIWLSYCRGRAATLLRGAAVDP